MKRLSKKLHLGIYLTSLVGCLIFGLVATLVAGLQNFVWYQDAPGLVIELIVLVGILAVVQFFFVNMVYNLLMLWKMWSSIQDGRARTTPGKAIGFLLIPFFNIYWIFQVWGGFPTDYNNFSERQRLSLPRLAGGVYKAYPVLTLLTLIPLLGILPATINMFMLIGIIAKTCDAINALSLSGASHLRMVSSHAGPSAVAV